MASQRVKKTQGRFRLSAAFYVRSRKQGVKTETAWIVDGKILSSSCYKDQRCSSPYCQAGRKIGLSKALPQLKLPKGGTKAGK